MSETSPATQSDDDALLSDLRHQLERLKARMMEHRIQMQAAGIASPQADDTAPGDATA